MLQQRAQDKLNKVEKGKWTMGRGCEFLQNKVPPFKKSFRVLCHRYLDKVLTKLDCVEICIVLCYYL